MQEKRKDRCNLFIDGEFYAGVSLETVMKFRLKAGTETNEKELGEMLAEAEKSEALEKAFSYVSETLKTKRQVKEYLLRKGFSEKACFYAIDKLKEYGYINDAEYAKRFIESTGKTQGKRLMAFKLMAKGVRKEEIESAYEEVGGKAGEKRRRARGKTFKKQRAYQRKYLKNL